MGIILTEPAWCEAGEHHWDYEPKPGRKPKNCPLHQPVKGGRTRTPEITLSRRIANVLEGKRNECRCGITTETTEDELKALGAGCTDPWYVCPTLDSIRRATA